MFGFRLLKTSKSCQSAHPTDKITNVQDTTPAKTSKAVQHMIAPSLCRGTYKSGPWCLTARQDTTRLVANNDVLTAEPRESQKLLQVVQKCRRTIHGQFCKPRFSYAVSRHAAWHEHASWHEHAPWHGDATRHGDASWHGDASQHVDGGRYAAWIPGHACGDASSECANRPRALPTPPRPAIWLRISRQRRIPQPLCGFRAPTPKQT